jgi:hypothetical protein
MMINRRNFGLEIKPISKIAGVNNNSNKQLTVNGCCDIIDISTGKRNIKIGKHQFIATIVYCANCGSVKATSSIKENKQ